MKLTLSTLIAGPQQTNNKISKLNNQPDPLQSVTCQYLKVYPIPNTAQLTNREGPSQLSASKIENRKIGIKQINADLVNTAFMLNFQPWSMIAKLT